MSGRNWKILTFLGPCTITIISDRPFYPNNRLVQPMIVYFGSKTVHCRLELSTVVLNDRSVWCKTAQFRAIGLFKDRPLWIWRKKSKVPENKKKMKKTYAKEIH